MRCLLIRLAMIAAITAPARAEVTVPPAPRPDAEAGVQVAALEGAPEPSTGDAVCTADRIYCIDRARYVGDVCAVIEATATRSWLDPHFFARLIWQESLFDAGAVSPAGALGIAQFMPDTARLRRLEDPNNPAEALRASAHYLAELTRTYGNIGLAAVAYNGGEARAAKFIAGEGGLAPETRAYVATITGLSAETWRDAPPATLDLALAHDKPFGEACVAMASARQVKPVSRLPAPVLPWGVIFATHRDSDGVERQAGRARNRFAAVLGDEAIAYSRARRPGAPMRLYMAQVGRPSRAEAEALCSRLRRTGGDCMVLRN